MQCSGRILSGMRYESLSGMPPRNDRDSYAPRKETSGAGDDSGFREKYSKGEIDTRIPPVFRHTVPSTGGSLTHAGPISVVIVIIGIAVLLEWHARSTGVVADFQSNAHRVRFAGQINALNPGTEIERIGAVALCLDFKIDVKPIHCSLEEEVHLTANLP